MRMGGIETLWFTSLISMWFAVTVTRNSAVAAKNLLVVHRYLPGKFDVLLSSIDNISYIIGFTAKIFYVQF